MATKKKQATAEQHRALAHQARTHATHLQAGALDAHGGHSFHASAEYNDRAIAKQAEARHHTKEAARLAATEHPAKSAAKHKKIQAQANARLLLASRNRSPAGKAAHTAAAVKIKSQLPQGYAMVFGKLRKITAGKPRTGIAKLKR